MFVAGEAEVKIFRQSIILDFSKSIKYSSIAKIVFSYLMLLLCIKVKIVTLYSFHRLVQALRTGTDILLCLHGVITPCQDLLTCTSL